MSAFSVHLRPAASWASQQPWWLLALIGVGALVVGATLLVLAIRFYYTRVHHLSNLPGGASAHWLLGDIDAANSLPPGAFNDAKFKLHGRTYRGHQILGEPTVVTMDLGAMAYVQQNTDKFINPPRETAALERVLGKGLVLAEHEQHRRQRRIMNQCLSAAVIRDMVPIFFQKTYEMRNLIAEEIEGVPDRKDKEKQDADTPPDSPIDVVPGGRKVDITAWLKRVGFDMIGMAGFDVDLACLTRGSEVVDSSQTALAALMSMAPLTILQNLMPNYFGWIPSDRNRKLNHAKVTMEKLGRELVARKKREFMALEGSGRLEKATDVGKDILSLIVRANMAEDLPPSMKLSDQEMVDQVATFLLSGSETSSTTVGWCLYRLAGLPEVQDRLRAELQTVDEDEPTIETLNALPYLEKVVRETLRLDSPVTEIIRSTFVDTVLPLSSPIIGADGKEMTGIPLKKGDIVVPSFVNINRCPEIWGEDAMEFNPDRHDREGIPSCNVPSMWGNVMTFNGGPRGCIGYRFALAEVKVLLFVLLRSFKFEYLPSKPVITQKFFIVMLPFVEGEEDAGSQLPLVVRPVTH